MKNIIPFKKDVIFKTNISEVTSISLENTYISWLLLYYKLFSYFVNNFNIIGFSYYFSS